MDILDNFIPLLIKYRNMKIYQGPTESCQIKATRKLSPREKKKKKFDPLSKDASNTGHKTADLL